MIKKLELTHSHHLLWDRMNDDRALMDAHEARALAAMLQELGGRLTESWQFDRQARAFWMVVADEESTNKQNS